MGGGDLDKKKITQVSHFLLKNGLKKNGNMA